MLSPEIRSAESFDRDVLRSPEPTVVVFWAAWCKFCQSFRPTFETYALRTAARFAVVRLDDEDNPLWERYDVRVVPSIAYFRDGELAKREDGGLGIGLSPNNLETFLREILPETFLGNSPRG